MDQGPPPVANSRFAAAAEADRSYNRDNDRSGFRDRDDRGGNYRDDNRGPPPIQNSRFAAAAEADGSRNREGGFRDRDERGPPPVANSRFAAAAAMAEQDNVERDEKRIGRDDQRGRGEGYRGGEGGRRFDRNDGPPPAQNSRFAAAAAADPDYQEDRERDGGRERDGVSSFNRSSNRFDDRGQGGYSDGPRGQGGYGGSRGYNDRGGSGGFDRDELPRGPRGVTDDLPRGPRGSSDFPGQSSGSKRLDSLLKPKPRAEDELFVIPVEKLAPEHAGALLQIPLKKGESKPEKKPEKDPEPEPAPEPAPAPIEDTPNVNEEELLSEFASGNKLGDDLKQWVEENRTVLPSVEKLLFYFLQEKQQLNPDVKCAWADKTQYGAALLVLVAENLTNQVQVLWAIQKYCDKLGYPKLDDEYVVQSMFRAMYQFDLALDDAFAEWKEDDSEEHEAGKLKAVIQTVNWFNFLEAEDEDEEEDGEEEE
jgi:eIF4-gamma/eIF5/eIF2-epsilon